MKVGLGWCDVKIKMLKIMFFVGVGDKRETLFKLLMPNQNSKRV